MEQTFSFDDILIRPKAHSELRNRAEADTTAHFFDVELAMPALSSSMSVFDTQASESHTITWQFAQHLSEAGGLHLFSRASVIDERIQAVKSLGGSGSNVGLAVSLQEFQTYRKTLEALPGLVSIDIANGAIIKDIDWEGKYPLIIGNYGNPGVLLRNDLHGKLVYKFGIGSGASCSTRLKTGVGAPQGWLINNVSTMASMLNKPIISDGGVKGVADFVKALALGADAVMMGYLFASASDAPWEPVKINGRWYKPYRGMASADEKKMFTHIEGITGFVPYEEKSVKTIMLELKEGLTSAMSYSNATTLPMFKASAEFIRTPHQDLETQTRLLEERH